MAMLKEAVPLPDFQLYDGDHWLSTLLRIYYKFYTLTDRTSELHKTQ